MRIRTLSALLATSLLPTTVLAADISNGHIIVDTWCQPCHATGGAKGSSDVAPPLAEIAQTKSMDAIRGFLAQPHGAMPDIQLSRPQIDDVSGYLATLKAPAR